MTLVQYRPRATTLLNNVDLMINSIFNDSPKLLNTFSDWKPIVDIEENEKNFILTADIPGVKKNDIEITLSNSVLTISGERKNMNANENGNFHYRERNSGSFFRSFNLPESIDEDRIDAKFKDGVLSIVLHKNEKSIPKEKIIRIK